MSKQKDVGFQGLVCNLCGKQKKDAHWRVQYPSHACNRCYRQWKKDRPR